MSKKVAIISLASGWQNAPWDDPTWERWGLNDGYLSFGPHRHCTRWFELHGDTPLTRARRLPGHFDRIREMQIPVYYLHGDPPTPTAIKLNTDALARNSNRRGVGRDYFACTNAYQIALALSEDFTHIALYGAPLETNREVVVERPCVAYWLGLAEGLGVTVSVHHDNFVGLLRHPYRYALQDEQERKAVYDLCLAARGSLDYWLPHEEERLGLVEPLAITDA